MAHNVDVQLPVQFEDFYVLSFGEISASPSYYSVDYIWPIGYRSCWHEKVTSSLFMCEVSNSGDAGPIFTVRRCSCSTFSVPCGSTVLSRADLKHSLCWKDERDVSRDSVEYNNVLAMLPDIIPPSEMDLGSSSNECPAMRTSNVLQLEASDKLVSGDAIDELLVSDSSPSSAWRLLLKKLADAYQEIIKRNGSLQCFCEHATDLTFLSSMHFMRQSSIDQVASMDKYFGSQQHVKVPSFIQGDKECHAFLESLMKRLRGYRFGLDMEFVQKIIEQLPGADACSGYVLCKDRALDSSLTSANKKIKIKKGVKGVKAAKGDARLTTLSKSSKRKSKHITKQSAVYKQSFPLGSLISSRLPSHAVGNLLQVHEFLCRFQDILGVEESLSFEELEKELLCPWPDSLGSPEKVVKEIFYDSSITVGTYGLGISSILETVEVNCTRCMGDKLTTVHGALLTELVSELLDKIASVVNITSDAEVSKQKRGHKKDTANWNMAKRIKLDMLPINQLTWPEVVRRYILAYLLMERRPGSLDIAVHNNTKVIRYLQGDGGIYCGSPTGVAGVDVDAVLLGRAVDKVFGKLKRERNTLSMGITWNKGESSDKYVLDTDGSIPEWVKVLDPVRKLPTNVGARIRNRVKEALKKNPPDWAKKQLEDSIAKDVYKGNASGPTKRAVINVLKKVSDGARRLLPHDRVETKKYALMYDAVTRKCHTVLRNVAASDINKVFCNLVGRNFNSDDNDVRVVFGSASSRPLDLRTIDLRLLHGTYGGSHEAFLEDVRELWINLHTVHMNRPSLVNLADELSRDFEALYENEVATLCRRLIEYNMNRKFTAEVEKELEELTSLEIPEAPWERGICKVCGLNRDDNNVLLCDTEGCNAEYHTYCLSPPLSEVPEGDWYCPTCAHRKQIVDNEPEGPRQILKFVNKSWGEASQLLDIATALEETEYFELGADKRTFLLKFLCDKSLNSTLIRQNLDHSGAKLAKVMQKFKAMKSKEENLAAKGVESHRRSRRAAVDVRKGGKYGSAPNVDDFVDNLYSDRENWNGLFSDDHPTKQLSKLSLRKEFLGIDSVGRLYWGFPDMSTHRGIVVNDNVPLEKSEISLSDRPANHSQFGNSGTWCLFQSDEEISNLVDYLRRNDPKKIELRDSILQWQKSMLQGGQQTGRNLVESRTVYSADLKKSLSPNCLATKATTLLEAKYRLDTEPDAAESLKKPRRKNMAKWCRCDCLEPVLPSRYHCLKCHETFFTNVEFEQHKNSTCGLSSSAEKSKVDVGKSRGKDTINSHVSQKESICETKVVDSLKSRPSELSGRVVGDQNDAIACSLDLESICKRFSSDDSNKKLANKVGLIGANDNPSFVPSASTSAIDPSAVIDPDQGLVLQSDKSGADQLACSLAEEMTTASGHDGWGAIGPGGALAAKKPGVDCLKQIGSNTLLSKSDRFSEVGRNFAIPQSSLKPLVGKVSHILRQLKINLLDMEAALPDGAKRTSRASPEWRSAWCEFVKSANTIYEMVQATLVLETMIKTEYIKNTWWWYWSSVSAAAKTSTISALALRIYTLDAAIDYQKGTTCSGQKQSRKRKQASEKAKEQSKKVKETENKQEIKDS